MMGSGLSEAELVKGAGLAFCPDSKLRRRRPSKPTSRTKARKNGFPGFKPGKRAWFEYKANIRFCLDIGGAGRARNMIID
jgi:hypothetical protein